MSGPQKRRPQGSEDAGEFYRKSGVGGYWSRLSPAKRKELEASYTNLDRHELARLRTLGAMVRARATMFGLYASNALPGRIAEASVNAFLLASRGDRPRAYLHAVRETAALLQEGKISLRALRVVTFGALAAGVMVSADLMLLAGRMMAFNGPTLAKTWLGLGATKGVLSRGLLLGAGYLQERAYAFISRTYISKMRPGPAKDAVILGLVVSRAATLWAGEVGVDKMLEPWMSRPSTDVPMMPAVIGELYEGEVPDFVAPVLAKLKDIDIHAIAGTGEIHPDDLKRLEAIGVEITPEIQEWAAMRLRRAQLVAERHQAGVLVLYASQIGRHGTDADSLRRMAIQAMRGLPVPEHAERRVLADLVHHRQHICAQAQASPREAFVTLHFDESKLRRYLAVGSAERAAMLVLDPPEPAFRMAASAATPAVNVPAHAMQWLLSTAEAGKRVFDLAMSVAHGVMGGLAWRALGERVNGSTQEAAAMTAQEHEVIRLSPQEQGAFVTALLAPSEPGARLEKAIQSYRQKSGA